MKRITTYLFSLSLIAVTLLSCKDDSLIAIPDWESGVHGYGLLTSDPAIGFSTANASATIDVNFKWKSIDKLNTVTNIDLYVTFNEEYTDKDGNKAVASHGGAQGKKVKSITPQADSEFGSFSISQEEIYNVYSSSSFDYGFGAGSQAVYSDPLGKGRGTGKKFVPGDTFRLTWVLTTEDGRVFDSWSPSVCTEFPEANCAIDWGVTCATSIQSRTGDWSISGIDAYGDGWNGASIDVYVDGAVFASFTVTGAANSATITIPAGSSSMYFSYNKGDWDSEVGVTIKNPAGNTLLNWVPYDAARSQGEMLLDLCKE
ncbi:MAG: hypothetical protein O3C07_02190 [Bacteroidetes bacterium]|nr:hypothetical protein [Bacteroidota bacterium]